MNADERRWGGGSAARGGFYWSWRVRGSREVAMARRARQVGAVGSFGKIMATDAGGKRNVFHAGRSFVQGVERAGVVASLAQDMDKKSRPNHVLLGSKGGPGGSGGRGGMVVSAPLETGHFRTFPDMRIGRGRRRSWLTGVRAERALMAAGGKDEAAAPMVVPPVRTRWRSSRAAWAGADRAATVILRSAREFVRKNFGFVRCREMNHRFTQMDTDGRRGSRRAGVEWWAVKRWLFTILSALSVLLWQPVR